MERYGVEWLQKGTHEKHLSVLEFEKKERSKEVAELDSQKQEISSVVAQLGEEVSVKKNGNCRMRMISCPLIIILWSKGMMRCNWIIRH